MFFLSLFLRLGESQALTIHFFLEKEIMKKTTETVKRAIYDLLPDTTSLKSAKLILLLLHVFRALTSYSGSYGKVKKSLLSTVDAIVKLKSFRTLDAKTFLPFVQSLPHNDTKGIQEAVHENLKIKVGNFFKLINSQNRDYKAVTCGLEGSAVQSISRCVNALPERKNTSHLKYDLYYVTTDKAITEAEKILADYLADKISLKSAKSKLSKLVK